MTSRPEGLESCYGTRSLTKGLRNLRKQKTSGGMTVRVRVVWEVGKGLTAELLRRKSDLGSQRMTGKGPGKGLGS